MSDRPVLVVGASGLVGGHLLAAFGATRAVTGTAHESAATGLVPLDMPRPRTPTRAGRGGLRPAAVICPAAVPNVERCELEPDATRAVNVDGHARDLPRPRARPDATFVFFSSEYVFDGTDGPYDEDARRQPDQRVRAAEGRGRAGARRTDRRRLHRRARVLRVRTRAPAQELRVPARGPRSAEGREFRAPGDQIGTPTAAANAAEVVRELVDGRASAASSTSPAPSAMLRSDFARGGGRGAGPRPGAWSARPDRRARPRRAAAAGAPAC